MKMLSVLAMAVLGLGMAVGMANAAAPERGGAGRAGRAGRAGAGEKQAANVGAKDATAAREAAIDKREANQAKRIEAGTAKGQLTPDEVAKLQTLETNISTMEASFKGDGKLSKDEAQQLRKALNDASLQIWAERHDTEGNQKPVSRLGKDVFAKDDLTAKIESGDLTKAQAKEFLQDFRKLANIKRRLSTETLTPEQRTKLQGEYNDLINTYFLTK